MKKKGLLLLGMLVVLVFPVSVLATVPVPPPSATPSTPTNSNSMMSPVARNAIENALKLKEKAHLLLDQAMEQDLDVSEIEALIEEADALLEKAQQMERTNPIPAGNMAREAAQIYEDAISDLEALLG